MFLFFPQTIQWICIKATPLLHRDFQKEHPTKSICYILKEVCASGFLKQGKSVELPAIDSVGQFNSGIF